MPDKGKVKDPLVGNPEMHLTNIEFYGCNKGNKSNQDEISGD